MQNTAQPPVYMPQPPEAGGPAPAFGQQAAVKSLRKVNKTPTVKLQFHPHHHHPAHISVFRNSSFKIMSTFLLYTFCSSPLTSLRTTRTVQEWPEPKPKVCFSGMGLPRGQSKSKSVIKFTLLPKTKEFSQWWNSHLTCLLMQYLPLFWNLFSHHFLLRDSAISTYKVCTKNACTKLFHARHAWRTNAEEQSSQPHLQSSGFHGECHCQNYNVSDTEIWPAAVENVFVPLPIRWNENISPEFEESEYFNSCYTCLWNMVFCFHLLCPHPRKVRMFL